MLYFAQPIQNKLIAMSGLYLHIPFCKQACHYCNFHFSTSLKYKGEMVAALLREMEWRKDYLDGAALRSIYFGGGTPSLLSDEELQLIFEKIYKLFEVEPDAEITLEANPDDLMVAKLMALRQTPVNRLSIGIQSFFEADLRFMNRAHTAKEAKDCIENALSVGFQNLTVDLIYGAPTTPDTHWEANLQTVFDYQIPHVSCYALTVEPKTALDHFIKTGKTPAVDEEQAARQFETLMRLMRAQGYEHYEISNFAKPGHYARHNSSYWLGAPYLGIGPAAHSFNGSSRQWNIAHNANYLKTIAENHALGYYPPQLFEIESLTPAQRYNEYIMTSLRTNWGCNVLHIKNIQEKFETYFLHHVQPYLRSGLIINDKTVFFLTDQGRLLADKIATELFWEDE